jgi:hypothetical protein
LVGASIGSAIVPVFGGFLGAIIGGFIGTKMANGIIRQDFDEALDGYNKAIEKYNLKRNEVQKELVRSQVSVDKSIRGIALNEYIDFNNIKSKSPLSDEAPINTIYTINIVLRSYLVELYYDCKKAFIKDGLLKYYNISGEGFACKKLLKQLYKIISSPCDMKINYLETLEQLLLMQSVLDKNQKILQEYGIGQKYLHYSNIISDCDDFLDFNIERYNLILFLWYQTVYLAYKNSINRIIEKTNSQFEWLQNQFSEKHNILEQEASVVQEKFGKVEKEKAKID